MRAFRIAYDGRPYFGFQRQPDVPTVENALFDALSDLGLYDPDDHKPPCYTAAGRTDAGVSALAQTVAFECPEWCTPRALNSELPGSVRAWAAADVPADFHATHDAARRTYVYHLYAPESEVDDDRAREALDALGGERDFHNLTPDDRNTVRDLSARAERDGDFLVLTVASGGFSRELVRRLTSLVRAVAAREAGFDAIERVLAPEPLPSGEGIPPAPPTPLVLVDVAYPGVEFDTDEMAAESAHAAFTERYLDGLVAARVADRIRVGAAGSALGDT
jgi:tRNA pseudouridine38-40 synthase